MAERHDAAVVRAIVQIGNDIGLNIIAEGIETKDQEARLVEMGCRQGQGYLLRQGAAGGAVRGSRPGVRQPRAVGRLNGQGR